MNRRFHELPTKPVAVHVRPGEEAPEGTVARPWPESVVSTGVPLLHWPVLRRALANQPQLKPLRQDRLFIPRG